MPNTPKHTPLPWVYIADHPQGHTIWSQDLIIAEITPDQHDQHHANAAHIVRCVNERHELLAALKGLIENVPLHKLNVRKDFSLLNAHAYATKVLHNAEKES